MTEMEFPAREPDPYDPMVGIRVPLQVTLSMDTRWSVYWVRMMRLAAYIVGPERAIAGARWGAVRLLRIRFDNGPWRWLRMDEAEVSE